jgi:hypothetical protein
MARARAAATEVNQQAQNEPNGETEQFGERVCPLLIADG